MNKLWKNLVQLIAGHKAVSIIALAIVVAAGLGFTGVKVYQANTAEVLPKVGNVEIIEAEETPAVSELLPQFKNVVITGESVEKDITLYFSDSENNNITGTEFSVKLVKPDNADDLKAYIEAIVELDKKINACQKDDESKLKKLYSDWEVAIEAYTMALSSIEGEVYSDDDKDGVISASEIDPGDYIAYMMFNEDSDINYEPADYETKISVKDKVEYKVVKNITKKIEKDKSSEDGQKKQEVPTENKLDDTAKYVESSKTTDVTIKTTTDVAEPTNGSSASTVKVTVSDNTNQKVEYTYTSTTSSSSKSSESAKTTKKQVTVTYKYEDRDGNVIQNATTESIDQGDSLTVSGKKLKGWTIYGADPTLGTTISVNSDIVITLYYDPDAALITKGMLASKHTQTAVVRALKKSKSSGTKVTQSVSLSAEGSSPMVITASLGGNPLPKVDSVTVNGKNATLNSNGKYEYKISASGMYTVVANVTWGDGNTGKACIVCAASTEETNDDTLKDSSGNALYLDEDGTKEATSSDYEDGKQYYYKDETVKYTGWQTIDGVSYYYDANGKKLTGTQVIQGVKYNFGSDGALLVSGTGIDVSKYQKSIDWSQASGAISFAIIRLGYRGMYDGALHEDPYFYKNMKNAKANGVSVGAYIYSTALTEAEAVEEASMAVEMVKAAGGCSYPIYLDMEDTVRGVSKLTTEQRMAIANAFCTTVQNAGYKAGVYGNKSWLTNRMTMSNMPENVYVWVAQYNTSCSYSGNYTMWQYSNTGTIPGINGKVDMDRSYF